jgi:hypothetical protein
MKPTDDYVQMFMDFRSEDLDEGGSDIYTYLDEGGEKTLSFRMVYQSSPITQDHFIVYLSDEQIDHLIEELKTLKEE